MSSGHNRRRTHRWCAAALRGGRPVARRIRVRQQKRRPRLAVLEERLADSATARTPPQTKHDPQNRARTAPHPDNAPRIALRDIDTPPRSISPNPPGGFRFPSVATKKTAAPPDNPYNPYI